MNRSLAADGWQTGGRGRETATCFSSNQFDGEAVSLNEYLNIRK